MVLLKFILGQLTLYYIKNIAILFNTELFLVDKLLDVFSK